MASSPQLENGYTKIANELLEQFAEINLSGYEWQILFVIIRKTYGFNKKEDSISLSQFCTSTGIRSGHVPGVLRKLEEKCIITVSKKYYINKYSLNKESLNRESLFEGKVLPKQGGKPLPKQGVTKERKKTTKESPLKMDESDFNLFWQAYEKKVGKHKAKVKFKKLKKELLPMILQAVEKQKTTDQWKKDKGRFKPHPTTWLGDKLWENEVEDKTLEDIAREMVEQCEAEYGMEDGADIARNRFQTKYFPGNDQGINKFHPIFKF
jgi:phage replication O-like protein O